MSNDEKILEIKKRIESKEKSLKENSKFVPVTNCLLDVLGKRYNLHSLNLDELKILLATLNMYKLSQDDLEIEELTFSGFSLSEWIQDVKSRLDVEQARRTKAELIGMRVKLDAMLSRDKKTELEIERIEGLL